MDEKVCIPESSVDLSADSLSVSARPSLKCVGPPFCDLVHRFLGPVRLVLSLPLLFPPSRVDVVLILAGLFFYFLIQSSGPSGYQQMSAMRLRSVPATEDIKRALSHGMTGRSQFGAKHISGDQVRLAR